MDIFIGLLWLIVGLFLLWLAFRNLRKVKQQTQYGLKTTGKIADFINEHNYDGLQSFPVIEYQIYTGEIIKRKNKSGWIGAKKNQIIEIYYYKDKPEHIMVNIFYTKYFSSLIIFFVSVVLIMIGIIKIINHLNIK